MIPHGTCTSGILKTLRIISSFRSRQPSDVAEPIFATFDQKLAELLLSFRRRAGLFQRNPFHRLSPGVVFDGDASEEASVASPQPTNWVLAVVENFGVGVAP